MNEQISRAIIAGEIGRVSAVTHPGHVWTARLQTFELTPLRAVANHEEMEIFGRALRQSRKGAKKKPSIFFLRQSANVKQEQARCRQLQFSACYSCVIGCRRKDRRVHAKIDGADILHAPLA